MTNRLLILGAGGFGQVIAELAVACGYDGCDFLDDTPREGVLGPCADALRIGAAYAGVFAAFGNNALRLGWQQKLAAVGLPTPVLIHPTAWVSPSARLGAGSCVLAGAIVNTHVLADRAVLINCGAIIDHDCRLADGAHICVGAVIKAGCTVDALVKIEAGQVVARPL